MSTDDESGLDDLSDRMAREHAELASKLADIAAWITTTFGPDAIEPANADDVEQLVGVTRVALNQIAAGAGTERMLMNALMRQDRERQREPPPPPTLRLH